MRARLGSRLALASSSLFAISAFAGCAAPAAPAAPAEARPAAAVPVATSSVAAEGLITFDSAEGRTLLVRNASDPDLMPLLEHFAAQQHGAYCGVATLTVALNALHVPPPEPTERGMVRYHTQTNVFTHEGVEAVVTADFIQHHGMTLDQLGALLSAFPLTVRVTHAADSSLSEFRRRAIANLGRPNDVFLVNYHRPEVGQKGGGHISPLAAYDEESDRFLLLDVARYRYPPTWIRAEDLYGAMNTMDTSAELTRGFVEATTTPEAP